MQIGELLLINIWVLDHSGFSHKSSSSFVEEASLGAKPKFPLRYFPGNFHRNFALVILFYLYTGTRQGKERGFNCSSYYFCDDKI